MGKRTQGMVILIKSLISMTLLRVFQLKNTPVQQEQSPFSIYALAVKLYPWTQYKLI